MKLKFDNEVQIQVISGETGEVKFDFTDDNAISDDFTVGGGNGGRIYSHDQNSPVTPYAFLLPDGPNWSSGQWTAEGGTSSSLPTTPPWRTNPWAPYTISVNNFVDISAEPFWKAATATTFLAPDNVTVLPYPTGIAGRWKMFFAWGTGGGLPGNIFMLKALGLTAWENDITDAQWGAGLSVNQQQTIFVPQTLVILPSAVSIHGRNGGAGTPDILQVSYFLSVTGAS